MYCFKALIFHFYKLTQVSEFLINKNVLRQAQQNYREVFSYKYN